MKLRVATFNIHHGVGTDGRLDLARTAAAIRATGAGLVALQEVDRNLPRSGGIDQPATLAEETGMHVVFSATLRSAGGAYGLALLTDEHIEVGFESLPRLAREEPRGAQVTTWRGLKVVATHLAVRGEPQRVHTNAVAALATGVGAPAVVLGDLNQGTRGLAPLRVAGFRPGPRAATFRRRQIDHVLAGPGVEVVAVRALPSPASDHRPLVAEVAVTEARSL